jgi:hypothetical protein
MNIQALRAYNDVLVKDTGNNEISQKIPNKNNEKQDGQIRNRNISIESPDKIITPGERKFFVKLFPESSEQIQKHVLFNKNGKLQQSHVDKGIIFDGKF